MDHPPVLLKEKRPAEDIGPATSRLATPAW